MKRFEDIIRGNFREMTDMLEKFTGSERNVELISAAASIMVESLKKDGKIIACGNGGSMCDAMHFCEELLARFRNNRTALPAISPSDPSFITCVGNDFGFDDVFSRFVEACGCPGDVFLGISTSGNSQNVVKAASLCRERGIKVVCLTGRRECLLDPLSDIHIPTPESRFSDRSQEIHTQIIHTLVQLIEAGMGLDGE